MNYINQTITWDEENRIQAIADNGHTLTYVYDDAGERVIKSGPQGETAYVNQFFVVRNREVATKHVFAGGTRLVSKMASQPDVTPPTAGNSGQAPWGWLHSNAGGNSPNSGGTVFEKDQYYFHPDHLGSSSYVTDIDGEIFQHLEYFPFGETFVEESSNTQRTPYLFTGKELDEETGLYYFGARYYDPRTSLWQSPDPILASYLQGKGSGRGVFTPANLNLFGYSHQRPVILFDPDGEDVVAVFYHGGYGSGPEVDRPETFADSGYAKTHFAALRTIAESRGESFAGTIIKPGMLTGNQSQGVALGYQFIRQNRKEGDTVILYGYSWGGESAVNLAENLGNNGVSVDLAITIDSADGAFGGATVDNSFPDNVERAINIFQRTPSGAPVFFNTYFPGSRGSPATGLNVENMYSPFGVDEDGGPGLTGHGNIQYMKRYDVYDAFIQAISGE